MDKIIVNGGRKLNGEITVQGAKNSVLPILVATLLVDGVSVIHNCPMLSDVDATIKILQYLGCTVNRENHSITVDSTNVFRDDVPDNLMREMRSSIVFLGGILGRMGRAKLSTPGGCEIGLRPIDLHLSAMEQFGATVTDEDGFLVCSAGENGLQGTRITLSFPSVGATENIILAATCAMGTTIISNAAREPEISDLADFLNRCGAKIRGAGDSTVVIEGVKKLTPAEHTVIPDRIVASTYLIATAMTGGEILINSIIPSHIAPIIQPLRESGCNIVVNKKQVILESPKILKRIRMIRTMPHPGFPTDVQAQIMALTSVADGTSVIVENIFESRFKHIGELLRFGAKIHVEGRMAVVEGVNHLNGANVRATDLRGGSAMILAGLQARGTTEITEIHHIDRGYETPEKTLSELGADIKRVNSNEKQGNA
ncbi:MAG: UDP-N-acetylglucosamine 1-carboxyvinyltransferase [Clostridia bacterium]|nr:UDP-N-acetylglucosamine 1-carboxyvinyltransferase [Clostridia bacterium]